MNETMNETPRAHDAFRSSPQIGELSAALAKAQAAYPEIPRNREVKVRTKSGGEYSFRYATLDAILGSVRKHNADNGLAITQLIETPNGRTALKTILLHSSGQWIMSETPIPAAGGPQEFGSLIAYMRRYSISAILNLSSQEDDDANIAEGHTFSDTKEMPTGKLLEAAADEPRKSGMASDKQIKFAWSLAKKLGWSPDDMTAYLRQTHKIESSKDMTKDIASETIEYLQAEIENKSANEPEPEF